jgi:hypothetical protein|tara:strand:+ start:24 stop:251 length:228 start_codon:yes stop_codon:yes gene_type:complete
MPNAKDDRWRFLASKLINAAPARAEPLSVPDVDFFGGRFEDDPAAKTGIDRPKKLSPETKRKLLAFAISKTTIGR